MPSRSSAPACRRRATPCTSTPARGARCRRAPPTRCARASTTSSRAAASARAGYEEFEAHPRRRARGVRRGAEQRAGAHRADALHERRHEPRARRHRVRARRRDHHDRQRARRPARAARGARAPLRRRACASPRRCTAPIRCDAVDVADRPAHEASSRSRTCSGRTGASCRCARSPRPRMPPARPLLVDGAQGVGAIDVDPAALGVDAYAGPGQKWLCGPNGVGFLWVADGFEDRFEVAAPSYYTRDFRSDGAAVLAGRAPARRRLARRRPGWPAWRRRSRSGASSWAGREGAAQMAEVRARCVELLTRRAGRDAAGRDARAPRRSSRSPSPGSSAEDVVEALEKAAASWRARCPGSTGCASRSATGSRTAISSAWPPRCARSPDAPGEFTLEANDGGARAGRLTTAHGVVETPVFMPVGTRATVKGVDPARARAARRPDHPRQHLPPALPAGRGAHRGARRAAPLHGLGSSAAHRFRRFPGLLARRDAPDRRRRRDVPLRLRRLGGALHARARDGGAGVARLRHRDGVRRVPAGGRAARRPGARGRAHRALGRALRRRAAARRAAALRHRAGRHRPRVARALGAASSRHCRSTATRSAG